MTASTGYRLKHSPYLRSWISDKTRILTDMRDPLRSWYELRWRSEAAGICERYPRCEDYFFYTRWAIRSEQACEYSRSSFWIRERRRLRRDRRYRSKAIKIPLLIPWFSDKKYIIAIWITLPHSEKIHSQAIGWSTLSLLRHLRRWRGKIISICDFLAVKNINHRINPFQSMIRLYISKNASYVHYWFKCILCLISLWRYQSWEGKNSSSCDGRKDICPLYSTHRMSHRPYIQTLERACQWICWIYIFR